MVLKTEDGVGELPDRLYLYDDKRESNHVSYFKLAELYAYCSCVTTEAGSFRCAEYHVVLSCLRIQFPDNIIKATSPERTDVLLLFGRLCELTQGNYYDYLD